MDDTLFDFKGAHTKALKDCPDIKYPQCQYGFFENLKPLNFAKEAIWLLNQKFDVWIATAPSIINPLCYTEKRNSVEKTFGSHYLEKLIIIPNKSLLKGDYLIDDMTSGKGQDKFEGEFIHFGSEKFFNWRMILFYFDAIK